MDSLCDIVKSEFGGDSLDLHHSKCIALVRRVLSPHFQKELLQDLHDVPFSLLVDESTDISITKLLACSIRYFSSKSRTIVTTFLDILELAEGDAKSLTDAVQQLLVKWSLNKDKFVGLSTDGASAMIGQRNSLQALLKQHYPGLVHIRCSCHSLDLAAKDAVKRALPSNLETMIRESYNWFSCSSSRLQAYRQLVDLIGAEALEDRDDEGEESCAKTLKLVSMSTTRWLVVADSIERILSQYEALKTHFSLAGERERCYDAKHLANMYKNPENQLYLYFLCPVLLEMKNLTKLLQSNTKESLRVFVSMRTYFRSLAARILKPAIVSHHTDESLCELSIESGFCILEDQDIDYGSKFLALLEKSQLNGEQKKSVRQRCKAFLVELFIGLQKRFKGSLSLMNQIVQWSFPEILHAKSLHGLLLSPFFAQDGVSQGKLEESFRKIKLLSWNSLETTSFWLEVFHYQDALGAQPFKDLAGGALRMICLPVSNGEVERVFSQVNLVKDKRRNRMSTETLVAILYCRFGLSRIGESPGSFMPPYRILHYDSNIYSGESK